MTASEDEYERLSLDDMAIEAGRLCDEIERLNRQLAILNQVMAKRLLEREIASQPKKDDPEADPVAG